MIDKHTDAQGELPTGDELRALAKRATFSSRDSASPSELVLAGWKAALARRATECQAQTSAARWQECMDVSFCESHGNRQFVGVMLPRPAGNYASTSAEFEAAVDISRAAQLADSTAPGAPSSADLAGWFVYEEGAWVATSSDWPGATKLYRAAPTAQSLTAGGAVQQDAECALTDLAEEAHGNGNSWEDWVVPTMNRVRAAFAAAPLPQVQSEALDAARWRAFIGSQRIKPQGSAGLNSPQRNNYAHMGLEIWTTYDRDYPQTLLDEMDADNATGRDLLTKYADIAIAAQRAAANQQPVTPSGALADNDLSLRSDGGVA